MRFSTALFLLWFCPASTVTEEFHYDLAYATDESRCDVEPTVAIQLSEQYRDSVSGLVCLVFHVVYVPFKVMTYVPEYGVCGSEAA